MFGDPVTNPKGWEVKPMGKIMTIVRGGSPRPITKFLGGSYPWIKIGDATKGDNIYLHETKEHIIEEGLKKTRLLPSGSLIFANCGVSLGFARIITFEGCIHDGWLAFSDMDEGILNKIFILKTLNSITQYFRDIAPDGTQPNLNTSIMKNFNLIMPPIDLQNKFAEVVQKAETTKARMQASLKELDDNFNALMQKAFKGEL
jgi:type I restriction enzyme S subunit